MDDLFTIRECFITAMILSPRVDETNAIQLHREMVKFTRLVNVDIDFPIDDMIATEEADRILAALLDSTAI